MNCEEARQHWHVFYDSEGDAELHLRINDHLSLCPACARWFFQQGVVEDSVTRRLSTGLPTRELWNAVREHCVAEGAASAGGRHLGVSISIALLAGLFLVLLVWVGFTSAGRSSDLAQLSAALHRELAAGREGIALVSQSDEEVEDYLRARVTFPVRCPPREDAGFALRGGGTCKFNDDSVAYIVGSVDGQQVSVFVLDRGSLKRYPNHQKLLAERQFYQCRAGAVDVVMSEMDKNLVLVVGRVPIGRLLGVLTAYGSYPDHVSDSNG